MIINIFSSLSFMLISICLLISMASSNILVLWVLIEVSGFCLIYILLSSEDNANISFSSFLFYLINGISSILIISGVYFSSNVLIEFGMASKFFMFPFSIALFYIFNNVSWSAIFIIGSMFKIFIISLSNIVEVLFNWSLVYLTLLVCFLFILFMSLNTKGVWFILNLSSSCVLFIGCIELSNNIVWIILVLYLILSYANIQLLSNVDILNNSYIVSNNSISINFLIYTVGFPLSINFVYKFTSVIVLLFTNNVMFMWIWSIYTIIETGYLFFYFSSILSSIKSLY
uniref:NADH dehydrogenase subunit 2 n=1 Tax=Gyrodactylus sp. FY-2015 TaxID=1678844 RepID=A0A7R5WC62_9PLAT|nr:NADH dehydrogenase subunit 2 [Gyrodactylus sp. FY-2015]